MDLKQKMMQGALQFLPEKRDPLIDKTSYIGRPLERVDAALKVTGGATFSAEYPFENIAYAALVHSTIARGIIKSLDVREAEQAVGVIAVVTCKNVEKHINPLKFNPSDSNSGASADGLPILGDDQIYWNGQPVAVVVAETQEQAEHGASLVRVEYKVEHADLNFDSLKKRAVIPKDVMGEPPTIRVGDANKALKAAVHTVDNLYSTPRYNHNAIEPHATTALWTETGVTVFDATQNLYALRKTLAEMFLLAPEKVKVSSPFVGGGFGGKGVMWQHPALCVIASRHVKRPVKLVLSRESVYRIVGGRTRSEQRVALGVDGENRLTALIHQGTTATTVHNNFPEQFSFPARHLYESKNFLLEQKVVNLDSVANTFMRAPGESIGTFALESALDELSVQIGIDPIELRRLNEPAKDPIKGNDFSMRNLLLAYQRGKDAFGWAPRPPRSQEDGKWLYGQGVATAYYPYYRFPGMAKIRISNDGTAVVQVAAHEMGMGTATVQLQHAADRLGLPLESITFEYGNTDLPESPQAGGSNQTASVAASISAASHAVLHRLYFLANREADSPFAKLRFEQLEARNAGLYRVGSNEGLSFQSILKTADKDQVEIEASSENPLEMMKYSMHSYGAQFCELKVNKVTGEVRVCRWVGSFDGGRILNPKTATSQFRGGVIMGIGMALTEETLFDERSGRIINASLSDYHVPVHLDIPKIEIIYNDLPDEHSPLGAHGIGEIGITGVAAAIANAVFNATGKRIRDLPITLDKLL